MLDCFIYEGISRECAKERYFIPPQKLSDFNTSLVSYDDTTCFALEKLRGGGRVSLESFVSLVITESGEILAGENRISDKKGEKWFVPYGCGSISVESGEIIVCYPPKI
jgi:hypothetical protein